MPSRKAVAGSAVAAPRPGRPASNAWTLAIAAAQILVLGAVPILFTLIQLESLVRGQLLAVDYVHGPWEAGRSLLAGHSPYVGPSSAQLDGIAFVYPALAALALAPLSLLRENAAGMAFTMLNIAALVATLHVLRVRDWRIYGVALLWPAVISGWETANLTLLLGLAIALAWRCRDRPAVVGGLVALAISIKVFVWPLALWLAATRRSRALAWAGTLGLAMNLLAWQILGWHELTVYVRSMEALTHNQETRGYSIMALTLGHGIGHAPAEALSVGSLAMAAVACLWCGRHGGDRRSLALGVATCLLATPILWLHYFALLAVPLAVARPKLTPIWLLPLVLRFPAVGPSASQIVLIAIASGVITAVAMAMPGPRCVPAEAQATKMPAANCEV
ncbi:MAG: DUF2029 domain-containing protein [Solirubrobacterales bacterium]|nr:DUF2029 domain-containing protein [Solirubrobacterales bacterium]